ncbi:MAG: hypothetical protein Fur0032_17170 [Terrimicrobiaceae bacterium]
MRLESEGPPDPAGRGLAKFELFGHESSAPVIQGEFVEQDVQSCCRLKRGPIKCRVFLTQESNEAWPQPATSKRPSELQITPRQV